MEAKKMTTEEKTVKEEKKKIIPSMNFAEYKLNLKPELIAAFKVFTNTKHDMEEKSKEEWDKLFNEMQNKRV
jgi:hypothetical protein